MTDSYKLAIIGYPLSHSLSKVIQETASGLAAYQALMMCCLRNPRTL